MLRRHWAHAKASAPTLEQKHRKYFLRFTYEEQVALTQEPAERRTRPSPRPTEITTMAVRFTRSSSTQTTPSMTWMSM